jgi:GlpG protein
MLLLLTGLAGNLAQAWQGASLFGGLSGVIYGLLGYIYIIDRFNPQRYYLPQSILLFMLLWLILGLTDVLSVVGFGSMANMAHLGGLLAGVGFGLLHTLWLHKSRS